MQINHKGTEFLRKFGEPSQGRTSWKNFVAAVGDEQSAVQHQISAAKVSDRSAYLATARQISAIAKRIDATAASAGFASDAYCVQLFG